ncbi:MAG: hypothetical protein IJV77_07750 [Clostridia bacterium]|nr:hypothetical protein [Clostridia bacterium]
MKSEIKLEQEYQEFIVKLGKAYKDVSDAMKELSPENQQRFIIEITPVVLESFATWIKKFPNNF